MKVLITTSGIGSRLDDLTLYTNKALIRVGKKPAISYIIEAYPGDTEFVITTGYYGNHVKEFLELAYPNHKFIFVDVDPYQGQGSSLGYSILCAKDHLQCPFIFNACDTIIDESISEISDNWMGGCNKGASTQYRTFSVMNHKVSALYEKGKKDYDFEYIGICCIKDWEVFWDNLEQIYNTDPNNTALSDCDVLERQIKINNFSYKIFNWLDIGNLDSLTEARESIQDKFCLLDKNDESIFIFDDSVIKFFHNSAICKSRVQRAGLLKGMVPDIIDSSEHFYKYKFADGYLFSEVANESNFNILLDYSFNKLWEVMGSSTAEFYEVCRKFYFDKTIERVNAFHKQNNMQDTHHVINGTSIPSITDMLSRLDEKLLCNTQPTQFHGDFILDNMIIDNDRITFLDWRHDFGADIRNGDMYYDLGKLNHNLIVNHGIVADCGYSVKLIQDNNFCIDIIRKHSLVECQNILHKRISDMGFSLKKVKILSALIWLNMSPLHDRDFGLFLYLFGKYMLFKELDGCT